VAKLKSDCPAEQRTEIFTRIDDSLAKLQNSAFTIMASLEFEDINRQLIEKISKKMNELYDNLIKVLMLLKVKEKEMSHKGFIEDLKKVADIGMENTHKQDMIDELLKEFGL
jgi:chemotaxis protein CheZ